MMCKICEKYRAKPDVCGKLLYAITQSSYMISSSNTEEALAEFVISLLDVINADPSIVSTNPSEMVLRKNLDTYSLYSRTDGQLIKTLEDEDSLIIVRQDKPLGLKAVAISLNSELIPVLAIYLIKD